MPAPRRIVLCLDGTWNSTYALGKRRDRHTIAKPSNVLKLCRAVKPRGADGVEQLSYYDIGVGSLAKYPGTANRMLQVADKMLGGLWGAGFEGNIEDALNFLVLNYQPGDQLFVFGFSRGAATARGLTRFLDWAGGIPTKNDAYYLPQIFRAYILARGARECPPGSPANCQTFGDVIAQINQERAAEKHPLPHLEPFQRIDIDFLGVWDTVMSLGSRFRGSATSTSPVSRSFHVDRVPAPCIRHARQALAIDERRYDFRPEIWTGHGDGQRLEQRWFAGVHSNVGGGYVDDGLANLAFRWILKGAQEHDLEVDEGFVRHYFGFAQDRLYRSEKFYYRILDALRGTMGRGRRRLLDPDRPAAANLTLAASAIHRLQADPKERKKNGEIRFPELKGRSYRPKNLIAYLASQPDLKIFLAGIEDLKPEHQWLPEDICRQIAELRKAAGRPSDDCVAALPPTPAGA